MPLKPSKHLRVDGLELVVDCANVKGIREALTELRIKKREYRLLERDAMARQARAYAALKTHAEILAAQRPITAELAGIRHFLDQITALIPMVHADLLRRPPDGT